MKKISPIKAITSFVMSALLALFFAPVVSQALNTNVYGTVGVIFSISPAVKFISFAINGSIGNQISGVALMAIQKEIWVDYIIGNLFKDQSFMQYAYNADQFVVGGAVVHIPQAGSKPSVTKNRTSLPASVTQRTDTDITYPLDEFTTDPTLIKNADTVELSYNKMDSVVGEHRDALYELLGDYMIYNWRVTASANILRTTGGAVASHLDSTTGNRKKFLKEDLKKAQTLMNKQNIRKDGRYALIPSDLLAQLLEDTDLIKRDNAREVDLENGVIMKLYGFNIIERSWTLTYDNSSTPVPNAVGATPGVADNDSILCWQKDCVERAMGTVDFFENLNDPTYYGDIYSALCRMGGRKRRTNAEGVVAIVQDASA